MSDAARRVDPLMEAMIASPDDDAPRLVWADREGGERGELVVLQCALAADRSNSSKPLSRSLAREDRYRMRRREIELLKHNGERWAADISSIVLGGAAGFGFVRGFVEKVTISSQSLGELATELFEKAPLVTDLHLVDRWGSINQHTGLNATEAWALTSAMLTKSLAAIPAGARIRSLSAPANINEDGEWSSSGASHEFGSELAKIIADAKTIAPYLRALEIDDGGVPPDAIPDLARLPELEQLRLGGHRLGGAGCAELMRALPKLRTLAPCSGTPVLSGKELAAFLAEPAIERLEQLDLTGNLAALEDIEQIANAPLTRLERLGFGSYRVGTELEPIVRSKHLGNLRELFVMGALAPNAFDLLASASFARHLRVLSVFMPLAAIGGVDRLLAAFPSLRLLDLQGSLKSDAALQALEAVIPDVRR